MTAIVVGAGIIGLTSALRLCEDGWSVTVVAKSFSPLTTSDGAAGFWFPYFAEPLDKVIKWSTETLAQWKYWATHEADRTALEFCDGYILYEHETHGPEGPYWKVFDIPVRKLTSSELPSGFVEGYFTTSLLTQSHKHLIYLQERIKTLGGKFEQETITNIYNLAGRADIIVNCTGLESRFVVPDEKSYPIKGQISYLTNPPETPLKHFYMVEDQMHDVTYLFPRSDRIILGGTAYKNNWDTKVDLGIADGIRQRCSALCPAINDTHKYRPMGHFVGLRPGRDAIRLDKEIVKGTPFIHNYGHGGSGWTVCWGTAGDVVKLAKAHHRTHSKL